MEHFCRWPLIDEGLLCEPPALPLCLCLSCSVTTPSSAPGQQSPQPIKGLQWQHGGLLCDKHDVAWKEWFTASGQYNLLGRGFCKRLNTYFMWHILGKKTNDNRYAEHRNGSQFWLNLISRYWALQSRTVERQIDFESHRFEFLLLFPAYSVFPTHIKSQ